MIHLSGSPTLALAIANIRKITPSTFNHTCSIPGCTVTCDNTQPPFTLSTGTENDDYDVYVRYANSSLTSWIYATSSGPSAIETPIARFRGTTNLNTTNNYRNGILLVGATDPLNPTPFCGNSSAFNNTLNAVPRSAEGPSWADQEFATANYTTYRFGIDRNQVFKKIYVVFKIYTTTYGGNTYNGNVNLAQTAGAAFASYNFWYKNNSLCCPNNLRIKYLPNLALTSTVSESTAQEGNLANPNDIPTILSRGFPVLNPNNGCLLPAGWPFNTKNSFVYSFDWNVADLPSFKNNNLYINVT
jgi:hypothetical protein